MLRKYLSGSVAFGYKFGFAFILIFGLIRFLIVMNANITGDFKYVSVIFLVMCLLPFLLLNKNGRKEIGITRPASYRWLALSFLTGILSCTLTYWIGVSLFQQTSSNWFYAIGNTYPIDFNSIADGDKLIYFVIYSMIAITFSPVGEELMYRGMIHESLTDRFGDRTAAFIDSGAFGITHLAHFGFMYTLGEWELLLVPAILWVLLIFATGLIFNFCKRQTGSIAGAIICHAGFNLAMTWFIFYQLFK